MVPSGYKEDTVYSAVPTDGSGDLSFTRASNGTRVNSAGLVEVCPWNLVENSENFSVWSAQGSSVSTDSTTAPNGTTTADTIIESNTTDEHNRFQEPTIGEGQFTYSIYLKRFNTDWSALYVYNTAVGGVRYWVNLSTLTAGTSSNIGSGIGTTSLSISDVGNGWCRASIVFNNPSGACRFYVANAQSNGGSSSYAGNGTSGVYVWGAQLNIGATAKPYFPTTDRLNVPRLTYQNGGGGCPSLLLEKQSTNLVTYSEQLDNAAWIKLNGSVTANIAVSPDGTSNADAFIPNTTSGVHALRSNLFNQSATASHSWFVKANGYTKIAVRESELVGNYATFNLTTGTLISTNQTGSIQNLGNGWYRCTLVDTTTGVNAQTSIVVLPDSYTSGDPIVVNWSGDGTKGVFAWGAQVEISSYATSYIPTTTAATRVADSCNKTGISSLIGQTEGAIFADLVFLNPEPMFFLSIVGTDWLTDSIYFELANSTNYITVSSVKNATGIGSATSTIAPTANSRYKIAVQYSGTAFNLYINGTKISGTRSANALCSKLYLNELGTLSSTKNNLQTKFNEVVTFTTALSDAECISLTTI